MASNEQKVTKALEEMSARFKRPTGPTMAEELESLLANTDSDDTESSSIQKVGSDFDSITPPNRP